MKHCLQRIFYDWPNGCTPDSHVEPPITPWMCDLAQIHRFVPETTGSHLLPHGLCVEVLPLVLLLLLGLLQLLEPLQLLGLPLLGPLALLRLLLFAGRAGTGAWNGKLIEISTWFKVVCS